ncbi:MAG: hypothetical protein QM756_28040 [Polyangiaceae bacterium]
MREVGFVRRDNEPDWLVSLRYDDADGLAARGIELGRDRPRVAPEEPEAFPDSRFALPPP